METIRLPSTTICRRQERGNDAANIRSKRNQPAGCPTRRRNTEEKKKRIMTCSRITWEGSKVGFQEGCGSEPLGFRVASPTPSRPGDQHRCGFTTRLPSHKSVVAVTWAAALLATADLRPAENGRQAFQVASGSCLHAGGGGFGEGGRPPRILERSLKVCVKTAVTEQMTDPNQESPELLLDPCLDPV